jgi:hypothetical protein
MRSQTRRRLRNDPIDGDGSRCSNSQPATAAAALRSWSCVTPMYATNSRTYRQGWSIYKRVLRCATTTARSSSAVESDHFQTSRS